MFTRKMSKEVHVSHWKKGDKSCIIRSEKSADNDYWDRVSTFTFSGYNPFPCYSMKSTYKVISAWMKENGWECKPNGYNACIYNIIDNGTGEVVTTCSSSTVYVPVNGRKPCGNER